ncbi:ATP synthase F1 subunit epsilon [Elusimicrobiota bacterium]
MSFEFTVITPEKTTLTGKANYISIPAWEGSMGILPRHEPYIVMLTEGLVYIEKSSSDKTDQDEYLSVSGGFAEITQKKVTLFAETAETATNINEERARLAMQRAKDSIVMASKREKGYQRIDVQAAQAALGRALVRLKTSQRLKTRRRK